MKIKMVVRYAFLVITVIAFASCNAKPSAVPANTDVTDLREDGTKVQVIVQVSADVARALHQRSPSTAASEELLKIIERYGLALEPMHRNTDDLNLQSYFIVEVPDQATAQNVINSLQQSEAVEAAYTAPTHGLP